MTSILPSLRSNSSIDPVVTYLPPHTIQFLQLDFVGTSDYKAVLPSRLGGSLNFYTHCRSAGCLTPNNNKKKAIDQPLFGPECRIAFDAKYRAWRTFKRHPTSQSRRRHREAAQYKRETQEWVLAHGKEDLRGKLRDGHVGQSDAGAS